MFSFRRSPLLNSWLMLTRGYLREVGWSESIETGLPVDRIRRPLPWMNYPFIEFLERRLSKSMDVFEYGSGYSTLWWGSRVRTVTSCEHDSKWAATVGKLAPDNAQVIHIPLAEYGGRYCREVMGGSRHYHIVVIDGRDRLNCATNAVEALSEDGVIIWDNTDRPNYKPGLDALADQGFRRLDFRGPVPALFISGMTSVLYRPTNCLGI